MSLTIVIGKSFSGKSTYVTNAIRNSENGIRLITNTTRPKREGESAQEYVFSTKEKFENDKLNNLAVAPRTYHTVYGDWTYWVDGDDILTGSDVDQYVILDIKGARELLEWLQDYKPFEYYAGNIKVLYVNTPWFAILSRTQNSNRSHENPAETLRRLADDAVQFLELDTYIEENELINTLDNTQYLMQTDDFLKITKD